MRRRAPTVGVGVWVVTLNGYKVLGRVSGVCQYFSRPTKVGSRERRGGVREVNG